MGAIKVQKVGEKSSSKCDKFRRALQNTDVDSEKTGSKEANLLLKLLRCECKVNKKACAPELAAYDLCHRSVLGSGTYAGSAHCGKYLEALADCADSRL